MRILTLTLFALAVVLAVPAAAAPADGATAPAISPVVETGGQNATSAFAVEGVENPAKIELGDIGEFGACAAVASCAGGGYVSCSASSGSCWFFDNCYAVCNGQYTWCGYRPYPCPV